MATRAQEIVNGCLSRAEADEPLFVLMGRDPHAPMLVRDWAFRRADHIAKGLRPEADRAKVTEALALAEKMEVWNLAYRERLAEQGKLKLDPETGIKK